MNVHEHQAKEILERFGVSIPEGQVVFSTDEALNAAANLNKNQKDPIWVVKAQIHAGGRGKAGGVKICRSLDEVKASTQSLLGATLVTKQTEKEGKKVQRVYIEEGLNIEKELYFSLLLDRSKGHLSLMISPEGGMDIEEVAKKTPEKIFHVSIDPVMGLQPFHIRDLVFPLGLSDTARKNLMQTIENLYKAYVSLDVSLLEINPLIITKEQKTYVLDAKMSFDDNALFRHPDIAMLRDPTEEDPIEIEATSIGLSYIKLSGNIGCMVNGAGLAMASMDIIKLHGGAPANFLDVGGGATQEMVSNAFRIILSDPDVKGVLVNIFGGIMRCDIIARGIVAAAKELDIKVPLVVRLAGTNVEEGKKILSDSKLSIESANELAEAAEKIVRTVAGRN